MAIINLRDYYPFYTSDCFMEVSEEVAEMFKEFDRKRLHTGCVHTATKLTTNNGTDIPIANNTINSQFVIFANWLAFNCIE